MTSSEDNPNETQPRGRPRVPVDYPAVVTGEEGIAQGIVLNLTVTGCEVESPCQFPIGARVSLRLDPPSARSPITIALPLSVGSTAIDLDSSLCDLRTMRKGNSKTC